MNHSGKVLALVCAGVLLASSHVFADSHESKQTLITNVHIFDGVNEERIENASVLIEGDLIKSVSTTAIDAPDATVIDGGGRTLLPGFIDNHVHFALPGPTIPAHETTNTLEDQEHPLRPSLVSTCDGLRREAVTRPDYTITIGITAY